MAGFDIPQNVTVCLGNVSEESSRANCSQAEGPPAEISDGKAKDMCLSVIMYIFPVIIIMGMVGNMLLLVVLHRKTMQRNSSSTYLMMLAVADTVVLVCSCLKTWIRSVTEFELLHVNNVTCKLVKYTFFTSTHVSAWLAVIISCERFLIVCFPFRASQFLVVHRPSLITGVTIAVIAATNVNLFWASELTVTRGVPSCNEYEQDNVMCTLFQILNLLFYSALPFIMVVCFNATIIGTIVQHGRGKEMSSSIHPRPAMLLRHQNERRLTVTLMLICVLWLVLTSPYAVVHFFTVEPLIRTMCYLLMYMNHSINFYIYCLTGKKFRYELKRVFGYETLTPRGGVKLTPETSPPRLVKVEGLTKAVHKTWPLDQLYK